MKERLPAPSEHQIQSDCIQLLRMKGYYVQRLNAGKYAVGEGRYKRFIQGVEPGTPDIVGFKQINRLVNLRVSGEQWLPTMDLLFVEVKRPGNKPTPLQEMKMQELEQYGARCLVVHSSQELEEKL